MSKPPSISQQHADGLHAIAHAGQAIADAIRASQDARPGGRAAGGWIDPRTPRVESEGKECVVPGVTIRIKPGDRTGTVSRGDIADAAHRALGSWFQMQTRDRVNASQAVADAVVALLAAPGPEPEWKPGMVVVAMVRGLGGKLLVRTDGGLGREPEWFSPVGLPGVTGDDQWYHSDDVVTDIHPRVLIDPERARDLVNDHFDDDRSRALLEALLGGETR